jgi:predicted outer membrane repeat protein
LFGHAAVHHNTAVNGGGILSDAGTVTLNDNTSIHHNTASLDGGGIYADNTTVALKAFSSITYNSAGDDGGGIFDGGGNTITLVPGDVHLNTPDGVS